MTRKEYEKKRDNIASSSAHPSVKEKALDKLVRMFHGISSVQIAKQQIEESKADISDIGEE